MDEHPAFLSIETAPLPSLEQEQSEQFLNPSQEADLAAEALVEEHQSAAFFEENLTTTRVEQEFPLTADFLAALEPELESFPHTINEQGQVTYSVALNYHHPLIVSHFASLQLLREKAGHDLNSSRTKLASGETQWFEYRCSIIQQGDQLSVVDLSPIHQVTERPHTEKRERIPQYETFYALLPNEKGKEIIHTRSEGKWYEMAVENPYALQEEERIRDFLKLKIKPNTNHSLTAISYYEVNGQKSFMESTYSLSEIMVKGKPTRVVRAVLTDDIDPEIIISLAINGQLELLNSQGEATSDPEELATILDIPLATLLPENEEDELALEDDTSQTQQAESHISMEEPLREDISDSSLIPSKENLSEKAASLPTGADSTWWASMWSSSEEGEGNELGAPSSPFSFTLQPTAIPLSDPLKNLRRVSPELVNPTASSPVEVTPQNVDVARPLSAPVLNNPKPAAIPQLGESKQPIFSTLVQEKLVVKNDIPASSTVQPQVVNFSTPLFSKVQEGSSTPEINSAVESAVAKNTLRENSSPERQVTEESPTENNTPQTITPTAAKHTSRPLFQPVSTPLALAQTITLPSTAAIPREPVAFSAHLPTTSSPSPSLSPSLEIPTTFVSQKPKLRPTASPAFRKPDVTTFTPPAQPSGRPLTLRLTLPEEYSAPKNHAKSQESTAVASLPIGQSLSLLSEAKISPPLSQPVNRLLTNSTPEQSENTPDNATSLETNEVEPVYFTTSSYRAASAEAAHSVSRSVRREQEESRPRKKARPESQSAARPARVSSSSASSSTTPLASTASTPAVANDDSPTITNNSRPTLYTPGAPAAASLAAQVESSTPLQSLSQIRSLVPPHLYGQVLASVQSLLNAPYNLPLNAISINQSGTSVVISTDEVTEPIVISPYALAA